MLSHCPVPPYPARLPGNASVVASKRRYTRFRYPSFAPTSHTWAFSGLSLPIFAHLCPTCSNLHLLGSGDRLINKWFQMSVGVLGFVIVSRLFPACYQVPVSSPFRRHGPAHAPLPLCSFVVLSLWPSTPFVKSCSLCPAHPVPTLFIRASGVLFCTVYQCVCPTTIIITH